jgi:hypothetical protein
MTYASSCAEFAMLAFYVFTVGFVAVVLFQAVNRLEPNRRLATFLIIVVGVAAIMRHMLP